MVEMLERKYVEILKSHFTEQHAREAPGGKRAGNLLRRAADLRERDALPFVAAALSFKDLLTYCAYYNIAAITPNDINILNEFRNRFAHAGRVLIGCLEECTDLAYVQSMCLRLLDVPAPNNEGDISNSKVMR